VYIDIDGKLRSTDQDTSDIFQKHFLSVAERNNIKTNKIALVSTHGQQHYTHSLFVTFYESPSEH
jgi:hypothetical protein